MKQFHLGQKVMVSAGGRRHDPQPFDPPVSGTVTRILISDPGTAWIALDVRQEERPEIAWSFPEDDAGGRGSHICAYVEDCEAMP